MTSTIATSGGHDFFEQVWIPVWLVLAVVILVGAIIWYLAHPDRDDAGGEAYGAAFMGPLFAYFWPVLVAGGLIAGFIWSLSRLRLRIYPRLKIPATDLRTKYPVDDAERFGPDPVVPS